MEAQSALVVSGLRKQYGPTVALEDLSFTVGKGVVHALLGENGAGKSTVVKLLSGLTQPDKGTITIFGDTVRIDGPKVAHQKGIRTAFQEISLVKDLTVAENFMLMEEPIGPVGMIQKKRAMALVSDRLRELGLGSIDVRLEAGKLDLPTRQKIEIARAISREPKFLLLDEPTASLSTDDVDWLGRMIERLRDAGTTIIFISHRMQEVRRFCSALTILRNGRAVGSHGVGDITDDEVIELMIGRSLAAAFPPKPASPAISSGPPAMAVDQLRTAAGLNGISLQMTDGKILGLGGLDGMGQRELFMSMFGLVEPSSGTVSVRGRPVHLKSPADAIHADIGISMVPEDRKTEGLFLELDGRENITLPSLSRFISGGLVGWTRERAEVERVLDLVQVARRALWSPARDFSGGNQQKIIIAKWLLAGSRILLLYDPTRGVDVGTKAEIYRLVRAYADAGGAVLFYSTDIPELVNLCDEVAVIYRGRIATTLEGDAISERNIMAAAVGRAASVKEGDDSRPH